ncbi:MAG: hypothetical protein QW520_06635 [Methanomassiliicoccales archaeon]
MFSDGDLLGLAGVYVYVAIIVLMASKLKFIRNAKVHRKFVHIMVGNIVFIWWVFDSNYVMAFLAAAPFIPLLLLASPYSNISKLKDSFLGRTSGESHDLGLVYYAISWTILAFFLFDLRLIASIAIVSMAYGDGMGGLVGRKIGKKRLLGSKTIEGTTAVFIATLVSMLIVIYFYQFLNDQGIFVSNVSNLNFEAALLSSITVALFVSVVELLTPGAIDNLVIPLGTSILLFLIWEPYITEGLILSFTIAV